MGHYVWLGLIGGAAAFAHCLGMCGGFALHLAQGAERRTVLARQLLWHAGRISTYVFLGALAGFAGGFLGSLARLGWAQNVLACVTGGIMILMALRLLGLWPVRSAGGAGEGLFASVFRQFFRAPTPGAALMMGIATGFLPCPIVLGFLAFSVQSGSVPAGMVIMAAVGVGAGWSLLLLGLTGDVLARRMPRWAPAVGATALLLLGTATALRGTELFHRVLGCPAPASMAQPAGPAPGTCCHEPATR